MPPRALALVLLAVACLGWGIGFPVMKAVLLAQEAAAGIAGPWVTLQHLLVRYLAAAALLLALAWWRTRRLPTRGEWAQAAVCGGAAALGLFLQIHALTRTSASSVGFLTQLYVVVLPLIASIRLRRLPSGAIIAAVGLALAGVALLTGVTPHDLRPGVGEAMVLAASLVFIIQILALEAPGWAGNDGLQITWAMFAVMAALTLPAVAWSGPGLGALAGCYADGRVVATMAAVVLLSTCLPYTLMNLWQRRVSSTEAGIVYCSEAGFTAAASLVIPGLLSPWLGVAYADEAPGWRMLVGGALVLGGCVLVQLRPPAR